MSPICSPQLRVYWRVPVQHRPPIRDRVGDQLAANQVMHRYDLDGHRFHPQINQANAGSAVVQIALFYPLIVAYVALSAGSGSVSFNQPKQRLPRQHHLTGL